MRSFSARTAALLAVLLTLGAPCRAAEVTDATGRTVSVPDHIAHVLPAGPPAAVLLAAIAPAQMLGFTSPVSPEARSALPSQAADLPQIPRLTTSADPAAIEKFHPDLIIDYGTISPRYQQLARDTQTRTGIPTLLFDGALDKIPETARTLGRILRQPERAEAVARFAEAILNLPPQADAHPRVFYARGAEGTLAAAPGTDVTAVFARFGWQVVAPEGTGTFRPVTVDDIRTLDPDIIILADPAAKNVLTSPAWAGLRAVKQGRAYLAPAYPFGWIEEPPSVNRLAGLAWLRGTDPLTLAALLNADLYGRVLNAAQLEAIAGATPAIKP